MWITECYKESSTDDVDVDVDVALGLTGSRSGMFKMAETEAYFAD